MVFNGNCCRNGLSIFLSCHGKADISKQSAVAEYVHILVNWAVNPSEKWACWLRFRTAFKIRKNT